MVSLSEVDNWVAEAQTTLFLAQRICAEAETKLSAINFELNGKFPRKLSYISNIFATTKEHQRRCSKVVEMCQQGVVLEKLDTLKKDTLGLVISQLRATKVPEFVVNRDIVRQPTPGTGFSLSDFISTDTIEKLKLSIENYESNYKRISELVQAEYKHLIEEPFSVCSKKYAKLLKLYNDVMYEVNSNTTNGALKNILRENNSLEGELALMLQLITNHYDQCIKGQSIIAAGGRSELSVDFGILENDVLELPEVTKDLQDINDIILRNDSRAQEITKTRAKLISNLELEIERQIEYYKEFKDHNIIKFTTIQTKGKQYLASSSEIPRENLETIDQLIYHYKTFSTVYAKKYFTELHYEKYVYPRLFLSKLSKFLNEELDSILKQERERRSKWLEKYGSFIPKEFKLPGELDQPTIVQIITEGLDEVDEDPDTERRILDLIAK